MRTLTVRLPAAVAADIEDEARRRGIPMSAVVRARLKKQRAQAPTFEAIADLTGAVDGLPAETSARLKKHLKGSGYGVDRAR